MPDPPVLILKEGKNICLTNRSGDSTANGFNYGFDPDTRLHTDILRWSYRYLDSKFLYFLTDLISTFSVKSLLFAFSLIMKVITVNIHKKN